MSEAVCREGKDSTPASRPHDHRPLTKQDANRTADSPLPLLPTNNAACGLAPPRSRDDNDYEQQYLESVVCRVTDFLVQLPTTTSWMCLELSRAQLAELQDRLGKDQRFQLCRRDYFVIPQTLSIGMETKTHAVFAGSLQVAIFNQIKQREHTALGPFVDKVLNTSTARIELPALENGHCPDASFQHEDAQFPGIVVEIAHTQRIEDLPLLAEEYIVGSKGNIRCVLGLKIGNLEGKQASLSLWERDVVILEDGRRGLGVIQTVQHKVFRTAEGLPDPAFLGLSLSLKHLGPTTIVRELEHVPDSLTKIKITAEELCKFLDAAEKLDASTRKETGVVEDWGVDEPRSEFQHVHLVEKVSGDRLRKFRREETYVAWCCEKEDPDYEP